ncbi:hypothetical protein SOVF_098460 [Spinacia oleracea]|nr:hypothetical protein SOVF_098460 [Spinacia oleracea]
MLIIYFSLSTIFFSVLSLKNPQTKTLETSPLTGGLSLPPLFGSPVGLYQR